MKADEGWGREDLGHCVNRSREKQKHPAPSASLLLNLDSELEGYAPDNTLLAFWG